MPSSSLDAALEIVFNRALHESRHLRKEFEGKKKAYLPRSIAEFPRYALANLQLAEEHYSRVIEILLGVFDEVRAEDGSPDLHSIAAIDEFRARVTRQIDAWVGGLRDDIEQRSRALGVAPEDSRLPGEMRYRGLKGQLLGVALPRLNEWVLRTKLAPEATDRRSEEPTRGRPPLPIERKVAALGLKAQGESNRNCAKELYGVRYPTPEQTKSVPTILKYLVRARRQPRELLALYRDDAAVEKFVRKKGWKQEPTGSNNS